MTDEAVTLPTPGTSVSPASETPVTPAPTETPADAPVETVESKDESAQPEAEKEGSDDTDTEKKRNKVSFKERIGQLHAQKMQAQAEAASARAEAQRLASELRRLQQADVSELPYEQQDAHRVRSAVKTERAEEAIATAEQAAIREAELRAATFQAKVDAAKDRMPDFDRVFTPDLPITSFTADFIADSDRSAEIAYFLGQNRAEAARIARLSEGQQGVELARIEARLSTAPPVRKVSQAPQPVATLQGGSSPTVKDPANMTMAEYIEWRKKAG